ncbi:PREDICTED: protein LEO1 homolog [Brassica oleracea var. oleracea]|uniref:Leo1-like protein n=1 Tax=Brassica oleracea var. oleracea TaxID=109376 RepID=A0A0D3AY52_BRAOL|nr:PREDICTED: protein LEO1 homolog [Brassica oleracea var. oleracea]
MVAGEVKRLEMMQNLFGDNSEEEEEEEIDSEHESNPHPNNYPSDEAEGGVERGEEEGEEAVVEVNLEAESEGEQGDVEPGHGESEGEREQSSQEGAVAEPAKESEEEEEGDVEDVNIRNVFGSSDDEDAEEYVRNDIEPDEPRSPVEDEEGSEKDQRPDDMMLDDDMVPEEDPRYESEDERVEARHRDRDRPVGPPMEVGVPFRPPPGDPEKMNMIKVSNIMGIDPKPFDAKTFVEEDTFESEEPGGKMRIRLANNIVRHRLVKGRDGKTYSESNARFVRWSDGSLQLLIGNEVLDITEQDARQDQNHLLVKHEKGILQSQGKIMKKMRFIPSSLTSNSHRLLTALVDSRQKKDFKVKNCVTDIDPEREKEKRERMENQNLKASTKLSQAREKVKRKYPLPVARRQLSTGYLEDALEEDEETDHYGSHRSNRGYEEDLDAEAQRERRIMNAKKSQKGFPGRSSMSSARPTRRQEYSESEREESEYETEEEEEEEEERPRSRKRVKEPEDEYEEEEVEEEDEEEEEAEGVRGDKDRGGSGRKRKGIESDEEEESPPRKAPTHRRMAMVYDSDED